MSRDDANPEVVPRITPLQAARFSALMAEMKALAARIGDGDLVTTSDRLRLIELYDRAGAIFAGGGGFLMGAPRTCTAMCPCGPNGELLRCGYGPGHKSAHSWASLPTFIRPAKEGGAFIRKPDAYRLEVEASSEWWNAVCSSLGEDYPHVHAIRLALKGAAS